ncbi:MAG TPA: DEAD/DEAH box helicase, partial [Actinomycetota bacterium]|nr:DEAD/DEAH box helicase [Actinomycetota bacterium]
MTMQPASLRALTPSFADLGASHPVIRALQRRGIDEPFPIQSLVLPDAIAGRDVLAKSRTGSGKTLAFAVPIVERLRPSDRAPSALILVPTRELAVQVAGEFEEVARARNLNVAVAYGGVSIREQSGRVGRAHILVATPGRLDDLARRKLIALDRIRILVLDEADRMLDMGFQPQVDAIVRRLPKERQTMFFSATLDGSVGLLARAYTNGPAHHEVASPRQTVDEVEHRFVPVRPEAKVEALAAMLREHQEPTLVFVRTRRGVSRLVTR